jgi:transposase InsO family protein
MAAIYARPPGWVVLRAALGTDAGAVRLDLTDSNHSFNIPANLLNRDFVTDRPNQKWAGDISYVWTREG